jgi:hypothetical protein
MRYWADPSVNMRSIVGDETLAVAEASRAEGGKIAEMRIQ